AASALAHLGLGGTPLSRPDDAILWQLRVPRVVLGALVGGTLAVSGAAYQGVFRNPLADPYLLGIAAGAGLGATLAITWGHGAVGTYDLIPLAAFAGGAAGVVAAYALGHTASTGRSSTRTRCRRSTAGSSGTSTPPAGTTSRSWRRTSGRARSCSSSTAACSTSSASATRRRRRSA